MQICSRFPPSVVEVATNSTIEYLQATTRNPAKMVGQQVQKKRNLAREKRFTSSNDAALIKEQESKRARKQRREERKKEMEREEREERQEKQRREIEKELKAEELQETKGEIQESDEKEKNADKKITKQKKRQRKGKGKKALSYIKKLSLIAFIIKTYFLALQKARQCLSNNKRSLVVFTNSTASVMEGMCSDTKKLFPTAVASIHYLYAHRADIWLITKEIFLISTTSEICIRVYSRAKHLSNIIEFFVAACIGGIGLLVSYKGPLFALVVALVILLVGAVFALGLRMRSNHLRLKMREKIAIQVAKGRSARMQARGKGALENSELDSWSKRTWELLF
ncbi:hypothetical protein EYC80_001257 [Monilinia laxa]|uniref:Uncharacterized protein n=1 Tax=Monilinia laxa TaxID=61186 RepID=A0A5N6K8W2_MONLA|nr:hypothetical protein EYC80_001257 [Monilinia laxa]